MVLQIKQIPIISILNSGFNCFIFSSDISISQYDHLKTNFTELNSIKTLFNDVGNPVSMDDKYYTANDFNKLTVNKYSIRLTLHLNTVSLLKHSDNLPNFLTLLNP